ncbi:phosphotransferase family protein [Mycoplasma sp. 1654_15]|uniref:phosphotransferase family protein n=1 Tax=Mycoplasma sp. 1654_15 TaxID=2725994 RepID=UPI001449C62F|nr:phosphotransferase [Mycoplasma sp. 1654_15]QJB71391.1 phosphotransferase [Mycoplasma sp. 1654_15]
MKSIKNGFTNTSFRDGSRFVQKKKFTGFNHKLDYKVLEKFDFVPKLISETETDIIWSWINSQPLDLTKDNVIKIASNLKQLHTSKVNFPNSNHAARIKSLIKEINQKKMCLPVVNQYFRHIMKILAQMKKTTPLHNDLWPKNILDSEGKIYFVDWEFASKGDRHYDLAYFIESARLSPELEDAFLEEYDDYVYEYLIQHKILVNYFAILWVNAQEFKIYEDAPLARRIKELFIELEEYKKR